MRKILFHSLMILLLRVSFFAQTEVKSPDLIDEFGAIGLDEKMARLDAAINQVQDKSGGKLLVRIYGGLPDSFMSAYYQGVLTGTYLRNNRNVSPELYSIEYCNVNREQLQTRIYLVSRNEQIPKCEGDLEMPTETKRFGSVYFYSPEFKFIATEDYNIEFGLSQGDYSKTVFNVLKSFVEKSAENKVYVVAYLQASFEKDDSGKVIKKKIDKKSLAPKMMQAAKNELIKNGFKNSQIVLIDGGYRSSEMNSEGERKLEFYFVPNGGEIPKPTPDYFQKIQKAKNSDGF